MTTQFVQEVIFLQHRDAREMFAVLYHETGWPDARKAIEYLKTNYDIDENIKYENIKADKIEKLDTYTASGTHNGRDFILTWNYAYEWVCLYRKVNKKDVKKIAPELLKV